MSGERYPSGHVVERDAVIACNGGGFGVPLCSAKATRCVHAHWNTGAGRTRLGQAGVSFFYFCDRCWIIAGPDGTSPRDRAIKAVST